MRSKTIRFRTSGERLQELIEEATVDCYDEIEQHMGVAASVIDQVVCPFRASVVGEEVEVSAFKEGDGNTLTAMCRRGKKTYPIEIGSLEFIDPLPEGYEWIEAYLAWRAQAV